MGTRGTAVLTAFSLGLVALAGCLGGETVGSDGFAAPQGIDRGAGFDSDTGAIEGSVIDGSLLPIANATVSLQPAREGEQVVANTTSLGDGRFAFSFVPEGLWVVTATHAGYGDAFAFVTVTVQEVTFAQIVMHDTASTEPYVTLLIQNGFIDCWIALIIAPYPCGFGIIPPEDRFLFEYNISAGHQATVVETDWEDPLTRSSLVAQYSAIFENETWEFIYLHIDESPIRMDLIPETYFPYRDNPRFGQVPSSSVGWTLETRAGYGGSYQKEFNETLGPACANFLGFCFGAGLGDNLRYAQYVTTFVHGAPADLADYTAMPDQ